MSTILLEFIKKQLLPAVLKHENSEPFREYGDLDALGALVSV